LPRFLHSTGVPSSFTTEILKVLCPQQGKEEGYD